MEYVQTIVLDTLISGAMQTIKVKQGDRFTRKILAKVCVNGIQYSPESGTTIKLRCRWKDDGTQIILSSTSNNISVNESGLILITLTRDITDRTGFLICDICFERNGNILSTFPFCISVLSSPTLL